MSILTLVRALVRGVACPVLVGVGLADLVLSKEKDLKLH